jgi:hypothetical protein
MTEELKEIGLDVESLTMWLTVFVGSSEKAKTFGVISISTG